MRKVWSIGASKEASLYFDQVFPDDFLVTGLGKVKKIDGVAEVTIPFDDHEKSFAIVESLLPGVDDAHQLVGTYALLTGAEVLSGFHKLSSEEPNLSQLQDEERLRAFLSKVKREAGLTADIDWMLDNPADACLTFAAERHKILKLLGLLTSPTWFNEAVWDKVEPSPKKSSLSDHFVLSMKELNLVDVRDLDWEVILELRRDVNARRSLRNLRLFFDENFEGKSPSYVAEKLLALEEDYRKTVRLWGLKTAQKTLSAAFNQTSAMMGSAASLASAIAGAPLGTVAVAAFAAPIAGATLEFSKVALNAYSDKKDSPVKYLTHLRKLSKRRDN